MLFTKGPGSQPSCGLQRDNLRDSEFVTELGGCKNSGSRTWNKLRFVGVPSARTAESGLEVTNANPAPEGIQSSANEVRKQL